MSINWVMLHDTQGFVRLPGEKPIWKSPPRTTLSLTTPRGVPANGQRSIQSDSGTVYLTTQRVVYLPENSTDEFKSFAASLLNLHDSYVTVPWFGPNTWQAAVQPVPGGNLSNPYQVSLKLTFNDGGAADFHTNFERIKERLQQAVDVARADNAAGRRPDGSLAGVNMDSVHLDQLPSYQDSGQDRMAPVSSGQSRSLMDQPIPAPSDDGRVQEASNPQPQEQPLEAPLDAPPGYEETQQQSLQAELERRLGQGL